MAEGAYGSTPYTTARLAEVLVAEYAAILARTGHWATIPPGDGYLVYGHTRGGMKALQGVAERIGVTDVAERAAALVAGGEGYDEEQEVRP